LKRKAILEALGRDPAPSKTKVIGYFHPYWCISS
jgi:hypothetical protein